MVDTERYKYIENFTYYITRKNIIFKNTIVISVVNNNNNKE